MQSVSSNAVAQAFQWPTVNALKFANNVNTDWRSRAGFSCYHYESPNNMSLYNLPSGYCDVMVFNSGGRGIAIAIRWESQNSNMWVNSLHQDVYGSNWGTWRQVI